MDAPLSSGDPPIDFVIGDRFGASAVPSLPGLIESLLARHGRTSTRNVPYAGGHVAQSYGRPAHGIHAVQIEINRALYLHEEKVTRRDEFDDLKALMDALIRALTSIDPSALKTAHAAE